MCYAEKKNDPSSIMMASSICALILGSTSEEALLCHPDFDIDSLISLSQLMKKSLAICSQVIYKMLSLSYSFFYCIFYFSSLFPIHGFCFAKNNMIEHIRLWQKSIDMDSAFNNFLVNFEIPIIYCTFNFSFTSGCNVGLRFNNNNLLTYQIQLLATSSRRLKGLKNTQFMNMTEVIQNKDDTHFQSFLHKNDKLLSVFLIWIRYFLYIQHQGRELQNIQHSQRIRI